MAIKITGWVQEYGEHKHLLDSPETSEALESAWAMNQAGVTVNELGLVLNERGIDDVTNHQIRREVRDLHNVVRTIQLGQCDDFLGVNE